MDENARKRKVQPVSFTKKLRSKLPRRNRFQFSSFQTESSNSLDCNAKPPVSPPIQADSSCSSSFPGEISSLSTWLSVGSESKNNKPRSNVPVEIFAEVSRPITRLYWKQKEIEREVKKKSYGDIGVELSESSCVESSSGAQIEVLSKSENNLKLKARVHNNVDEQEERIDLIAASDAISLSEVSCIQHGNAPIISEQGEFAEKTSKLKVIDTTADRENEASTISLLESHYGAKDQEVSEFSVDQKPKDLDLEYFLACSEDFSYEETSEYSTSQAMTLSEFESELFPDNSSLVFSDYSPSMLIDSLEESSQESDINSPPPVYFPFFLQYQKQFSKLDSPTDTEASGQVDDPFYDEFTLLRFENEEYEESYKKFRSRERKLVLNDYTDEYFSTTEFGELVLQQRLLMVNWIVEQADVMELQSETMFLGVSLLDRFLSRGFFKHKRKLQILGIACLTLATRLEENQPYNCARQSAFYVGKNVYSRFEVIGMEWLVQEILNFQCFLPTIYNFLWFYLKAANATDEVEKSTKYLAALSLPNHERLWYWPSTVAAGLVILACLAANQDSSCQLVMETHVRSKNDDLPECLQSLEWLVKHVS